MNIGDKNEQVGILQKALGVTVNNDFGPLTAAAVITLPQVQALISSLIGTSIPVPTGGPIKGIDIYHLDIPNDWAKIKNAGYDYVFIKASDGKGNDPQFLNYFRQAKAHGFLTGAYHFYEPGVSVASQLTTFESQLSAAGWKKGVDLPPVLDFETFSSSDPTSTDYNNANLFISNLQVILGVKVIIYASDSVIENAPSWISKDIVWDARYGAKPKYSNWKFWQNSPNASVPGLNNGHAASDTDIFQGSVADLQKLITDSVIS